MYRESGTMPERPAEVYCWAIMLAGAEMITMQQSLIDPWDRIVSICKECEKCVRQSDDILLISACFATQPGRDQYLTLLPHGEFCSSSKSISVTEGGNLLKCPEGKWCHP
jgi:hypothetical protein